MLKSIWIIMFLVLVLSSCNSNLKKEYYTDGSLKQEYYSDKNEMRYGTVTEYYLDGKIKWQSNYINDTLEGAYKEYYPNGQLSILTLLKKGQQDGRLIEYFENGKLKQNSEYKLGKKNGLVQFFYQNGNKFSHAYVKDDLTQYTIHYDSLGNIIKEDHLVEVCFLNKFGTTDSVKIKTKLVGFYDKGQTPVFVKIDNYPNVKMGHASVMIFNPIDSCYYFTFAPQKTVGKYLIGIRSLISRKFEQMSDTIVTITD